MHYTFSTTTIAIFMALLLIPSIGHARNVFLNGTDISSARHQNLEQVNISIDGNGDIFILAPQYQVNEESTYVPLSSWKESPGRPDHKVPGKLNPNPADLPEAPAQSPEAMQIKEQPVPKLGDGPDSKPGSKSPPPGAEDQNNNEQ